jgi:hypothetical protein
MDVTGALEHCRGNPIEREEGLKFHEQFPAF